MSSLPKDWSTNDALRWLGLTKRHVEGSTGSAEVLDEGEPVFRGSLPEINEYLGKRIASKGGSLVQGELFA